MDRLDKFVVASLEREGATSSRTSVKRWIESGTVLVDGRQGTPIRSTA